PSTRSTSTSCWADSPPTPERRRPSPAPPPRTTPRTTMTPTSTTPPHNDPTTAPFDTDVLILGAGPVGLTLANLLGAYGVRTTVADAGEKLIDYPRGVGLDDESLRS